MKIQVALTLLLVNCAVAASHADDPVVYSQPYNQSEDTTWDSYATPSGSTATVYDNFSLSAATNVTAVQWQGDYIDHGTLSNNPTAPDATSFTISFWSDNNGQPGARLASSTLAAAGCAQTSLGTIPFNDFNDPTTYQLSFYTYRAVLATPFATTAGQTYWVSIVSQCSAESPIWSWYASTSDGNTTCIQDVQSNRITRAHDRAFALEGAPVTTPAFFNGETALANGVYYLNFPNGNYFGYYSFLSDPHYIYHFDLGYEYVFDAGDGQGGVYFYDFTSGTFFYTSPGFPFPYLYDFTLNSTVYYYPDPANAGHYNTNGVRYFYVFNTGQIISK